MKKKKKLSAQRRRLKKNPDLKNIDQKSQAWYIIKYHPYGSKHPPEVYIGTLYKIVTGEKNEELFWFKNIIKYFPNDKKWSNIMQYSNIIDILKDDIAGPFDLNNAKNLVEQWHTAPPKSPVIIRKKFK